MIFWAGGVGGRPDGAATCLTDHAGHTDVEKLTLVS
jgi:hypothetical protein